MRESRTSRERTVPRLARLAAGLALTASALLCATGSGSAARDPLPADIPDYQAALAAVKSPAVLDAVCRFLGVPLPEGGAPAPLEVPDEAEPCAGLPAFKLKDPLPVNEITPGFVSGQVKPTAAEAVKLTHLVSSLDVAVNNRQATVMLAPSEGGGWHLAAVRDGDGDAVHAGKAELGSLVFSEPQIRAWYQLKLLTVTPLNEQARQGLDGRASMTLADYQKLVQERYADKLGGSDYDNKGFSSGYATASRVAEHDTSSAPLVLGGSGAALVLAGGAFLLHRRRRTTG
ncbi:hypothetical protein AB0I60_05855 [Actinosynnema sp. NPDC050436]|uniref:hypothetical protein n=1 Tax=Actinosynnema sp. NPDC050436 TaxID=3155659 RepID=UPI00340FAF73